MSPGLGPDARRWILRALIVFCTMQLATMPLALFGIDVWPFAPYFMFAFSVDHDVVSCEVVLHEDDGRTQTVPARRVLPIEFFRINRLMLETYVDHSDRARQDTLARTILARLNAGPWAGFDERFPSARPTPGHRFVALDVIARHQDFGTPGPVHPPRTTSTGPVYSYREPTTLPSGAGR